MNAHSHPTPDTAVRSKTLVTKGEAFDRDGYRAWLAFGEWLGSYNAPTDSQEASLSELLSTLTDFIPAARDRLAGLQGDHN